MPVERFSAEEETRSSGGPSVRTDEGVLNTRPSRGLAERLKFPAGVGVAVAALILAWFLLTEHRGRPGTSPPQGTGTMVVLDPQRVNLAEPGTSLDVRIVFEASSPRFAAVLRTRTAQLADIAITVINGKTIEDLDTDVERNRLKRELADAAGRYRYLGSNDADVADDAHIANVHFTRFYYRTDHVEDDTP